MFATSLDAKWMDIDPLMMKETITCDIADDCSACLLGSYL